MSAYDPIAHVYDAWSRTVVEDVPFYVEEAVRSGGPVLELGVGTGRIAIAVAVAGIGVVGVDLSAGMLRIAREQAELAGVSALVELRQGDFRNPPVEGPFPLVAIPFRSLLHMETDRDRREALRAARGLLADGGRLVFDVFTPSEEDIDETHGRWLEREPGIWERADWNARSRTLILRLRSGDSESEMSLSWLDVGGWRSLLAEEGLAVEALYGWFDRSPWDGGEDSIWVCSPA